VGGGEGEGVPLIRLDAATHLATFSSGGEGKKLDFGFRRNEDGGNLRLEF